MGFQEKFNKIKIIRNKDKGNAWERYVKSFFHAIDGIKYAVVFEHNIIQKSHFAKNTLTFHR